MAKSILEITSSYTDLKTVSQTSLRGLCPLHRERTASFYINIEQNSWYCFGCGIGGGVIQFIMSYHNVDYDDAIGILKEKPPINITKPVSRSSDKLRQLSETEKAKLNSIIASNITRLMASESAQQYLDMRQLKSDTIKHFELGYISSTVDFWHDRIAFVWRDLDGNPVGYTARTIDDQKIGSSYPKTLANKGFKKAQNLYGIYQNQKDIKASKSVIIVEGEIDALTCWQNGFRNVVALGGSYSPTPLQIEALKSLTNTLILAFDSDKTDKMLLTITSIKKYNKENNCRIKLKLVNLIDGDPDEIIKKDINLWQQYLSQAQRSSTWIINYNTQQQIRSRFS